MGFQIGDKVRIINGVRKDQEATVTSDLKSYLSRGNWPEFPVGTLFHELDLPPFSGDPGSVTAYPPCYLKLIYDGHEPCSFEDSIWNPLKETA